MTDRAGALAGCLLGTAVGDAIGLPYEGLSPCRASRLFGPVERHRFALGCGMVSDDTEHACLTAQALLETGCTDPDRFEQRLAHHLKLWLAGLPAGIGLATLRALLRLALGVPPSRSGVFSAGNGPAMRAPILGVACGGQPDRLRELVLRSTRMTHTDPKAYWGALAAAWAAHEAATAPAVDGVRYVAGLAARLPPEAAECMDRIGHAVRWAGSGQSTDALLQLLGSRGGVSGYIYHTVPCVIGVWLRYPDDYRLAVQTVVEAGGDADTAGAILGGIVGARVGERGIPVAWLEGVREWPRGVAWMRALAHALDAVAGQPARAPRYPAWGLAPRNLLFTVIVLLHGFRRCLPPYGA